jgi:hypothetical protein
MSSFRPMRARIRAAATLRCAGLAHALRRATAHRTAPASRRWVLRGLCRDEGRCAFFVPRSDPDGRNAIPEIGR